jgi:MFS family permease
LFEDYKGIPREASYLIYAGFLPSFALGMFYTDMAYFLPSIQGVPLSYVGTLQTVMGITMVSTSVPLGISADRFGRKRFVILGGALVSITIVMFALTTSATLLFLAAVIEGLSEAAFAGSSGALLAEKAGDRQRTSAFSYSFFLNNIGSGLGSFSIASVSAFEALGIGAKQAHVWLYLIFAMLGLSSVLIVLKVKEPKGELVHEGKKNLFPRKSLGVLVKYAATGSIIAFGAGMVVPLMSGWLQLSYGVSDQLSGPMLGISTILMGVTNLAVPRIARRLGVVKAIVVTQGSSTLLMFAVPFSPNFATASVVYISRSVLMNMSSPLEQSLILGMVSPDERSGASGISAALWRLPNSISTGIGGYLMGEGYLALPFYFASLLYIISIMLFWYFFSSVKLPEEMVLKGV